MMKLGIPRFGIYSSIIKSFLEDVGLEVIMPSKITRDMIRDGAANSSDFFCFPFKYTLGQEIWCLEQGATDLLFYNSCGLCRLKHYYQIQELTLKELGYDFKMNIVTRKNILKMIGQLGHISRFQAYRRMKKVYSEIKAIEERAYRFLPTRPLKIGIIGEIGTMAEPDINFDIVKKLQRLGANVHMSLTVSDYWSESTERGGEEDIKEAKELLSQELGGHGFQSICNTIYYGKQGYDGVIHVLPLSCFPEGTYITTTGFTSTDITQIKVGDKVLTHKGRFRKVASTYSRLYQGNLINIDCGGLSSFHLTPEHPIFSAKRQWGFLNPKFNEARTLRKGDFIAIPKVRVIKRKRASKLSLNNPHKPKYADLTSFPYTRDMLRLLGYYLAEGSLGYDKYKQKGRKYLTNVTFTLNAKEDDLISDIDSIVKSNLEAGIHHYTHPHRPHTLNLNIYNRSLAYALAKLGGQYCDKKRLRPEIMLLEPELQLEIIKGFFKGDGHLVDEYGETRYIAVTTSPTLASQLFWILDRSGIRASLGLKEDKGKKPAYVIRINYADGVKRLGVAVENRVRNERFINRSGYFLVPIRSIIEKPYSGMVYNLEVEGDNSYIANYLAVHNCMPENTVEVIVDYVADKYGIPLYRFPIDESNFEPGFNTRLETFTSMLLRRKQCQQP